MSYITLCYWTLAFVTCGISSMIKQNKIESNENHLEVLHIFPGQSLLKHVCIQYNITEDQCTCASLPDVCEVQIKLQTNDSQVETIYRRRSITTIVYVSVTVASTVFGLIGNALVLIVSYQKGRYLHSGKLHIAELAVVNFLFCLAQLVNTLPLYWTNVWIFGRPMCKVFRSLIELGSFLTIGFVVIIAVERLILVIYPLKRVFVEKIFRHSFVLGNVIISTLTVIPYTIGLEIDGDGRCVRFGYRREDLGIPYHCLVIVMYCVIPVIMTSTIYLKIVSSVSNKKLDNQFSNSSMIQQRARAKKNRRLVLTTMMTLFAFVVCTLPTHVIAMYALAHNYTLDMDLYLGLVFVAYVTHSLQSTLNPILYSMMANKWKKDMESVAQNSGNKFMRFIGRIRGLKMTFSKVTKVDV